MMKQKLAKVFSGLLTAVLLATAPVSVSASEQPSGWGYWGLPEDGIGSISFTLSQDEHYYEHDDSIYIAGISYDVYQVWTLDANGGVGSVNINDPFTSELSESDLLNKETMLFNDSFDEKMQTVTALSEAVLKKTEDLAARAADGTPYKSGVTTDKNGFAKVEDLPFGGYLFVPSKEQQTGEVYAEGQLLGTGNFELTPFLISVPVRVGDGDLTKIDDISEENSPYRADVQATPKLSHVADLADDTDLRLAKVDVAGGFVTGAKLQVIRRGEDPAAQTTVRDRIYNEPAIWYTEEDVHTISLDEGEYTLVEVDVPEGYSQADPVNFAVDHMGNVTYFNENWVKTESAADDAGLAVSAEGLYVNGASSKTVTMADPIPIEKFVNDKKHEDLKIKEEIVEYKIVTLVATGAKESFTIKDVMEPVLEFATEVDGNALSFADRIKIVVGAGDNKKGEDWTSRLESSVVFDTSGARQTLVVTLRGADLKEAAGKKIEVTFLAKIKADADLSAYQNNTVPNEATYQIDNLPEVKSNPVTIVPPDKTKGTPTPTPTKPGTPDKPGTSTPSKPKTGDTFRADLYIGLLVAAAFFAVVLLATRRRHKEK